MPTTRAPKQAIPTTLSSSSATPPPSSSRKRSSNLSNDDAPPPSKKAKRKTARQTVEPHETEQVICLPSSSRLPLADADVYYLPDFVSDEEEAKGWIEELLGLPSWYRPTLKVYGKSVTQSRQIAAYATDPKLEVKYSGHPVEMHYEWTPLLQEIKKRVEEKLQVKFNHCMLNLYENGQIYIGAHRDNKENRVIASLSLGAVRTFNLTHTAPPSTSTTTTTPSSPSRKSSSKRTKPASPPVPTPPPPSAVSPYFSAPIALADPDDKASGDVDAAKSEGEAAEKEEEQYKYTLPLASGSLLVMQGTTQKLWKHEIPKEKKVSEGRISLTFRQLVF